MARYIDLDKAIERLKASPAFPNMGTDAYFLLDLVEDLLNKQPTVDVVPMVEVRRLQETVECQRKVIDEVRAEVAREIFGEIEEFISTCIENDEKVFNSGEDEYYDGRFMGFKIIEEHLAELKKKYTEDNE